MINLKFAVVNLFGSKKTITKLFGLIILSCFKTETGYSQQINSTTSRNKLPEFPTTLPFLKPTGLGGNGGGDKGPCFTLPLIPIDSITESANPVIWVYIKPTPVTPESTTEIIIGYRSLDRSDKDDKAVEDSIIGADSRFKSYTIPSKAGREFSLNKKYRIDITCGSETSVSTFFIERKQPSVTKQDLHPFALIVETARLNLWSEAVNLLFNREIKSQSNSNTLFEQIVKDYPFRSDVTDGVKIDMIQAFKKLKI